MSVFKICAILKKNPTWPFIALSLKQHLLNTTKTNQNVLIKRCNRTSLAGPWSVSVKQEEKVTPVGWLLLLIPITTFGLGCWQVKRKAWKEQLIKDLETLTKTPPVELPEDLSHINDMEYHVVKVKGTFLHDKELIMGPRSFVRPDGGETTGGLISQRDSGNGYWVVTPFKLAERDDVILINRGWIPRNRLNPKSRPAGQIQDEVEMTCIVRSEEKGSIFTPTFKGGIFLFRDLKKMCALTGAQPVFLDALHDSSVAGGPVGGQTRIHMHNDHLSYLITWYSLSLATGFLWYRTVLKRKPI